MVSDHKDGLVAEDDRAVEWAATRRRRNLLVSGILVAVVALGALGATLLGAQWAVGFVGSFAAISAVMLLIWRAERRAARDRTGRPSSRSEDCASVSTGVR